MSRISFIVPTLLALPACLPLGEVGDDDPATTHSPATDPTASVGLCEGVAAPCRQFYEISSCHKQDGCSWSSSPSPGDCEPRNGKRVLSCSALRDADDCVAQLGCRWVDAAGGVTEIGYGVCSGEEVPCSAISDETQCKGEPGCWWLGGDCERNYNKQTECGTFSARNPDSGVHPDAGRAKCEARTGCTWEPLPAAATAPEPGPAPAPQEPEPGDAPAPQPPSPAPPPQ